MGNNERVKTSVTVMVDVGRYACSICFDDGEKYDVYMCADGARAYAENGDRVDPGSFDGDAFCRCVPRCRDCASERLDVLPEGDAAIDRNVRDLVDGRMDELVLTTGAGRADMVLRVEGRVLSSRADVAGCQTEDCIDLDKRSVADSVVSIVSLLDDEYMNWEVGGNA